MAGVLLLEAGAPVDSESRFERETPLHHAARTSRNPAIARLLIEAGADVDARAWNDLDDLGPGATPLHYAARYDVSAAVVEALVEAGADVDAIDRGGRTPRDLAGQEGRGGRRLTRLVGRGGVWTHYAPAEGVFSVT